jgi:protein-tyrosine-phosphatase
MKTSILFLCPHGAAKSVLAAAYCLDLAGQRGLDLDIAFAGTDPDPAISTAVAKQLAAEGLAVPNQAPRRVTQQDLERADWIVSLGCELAERVPEGKSVLNWPDIPPPSLDIDAAAVKIRSQVFGLIGAIDPVE